MKSTLVILSFANIPRNLSPCFSRSNLFYTLFFLSAQVTPFKLSVFTDNFEITSAATAVGAADVNEASAGVADTPTGTAGFSLGFAQIAC